MKENKLFDDGTRIRGSVVDDERPNFHYSDKGGHLSRSISNREILGRKVVKNQDPQRVQ